MSVLKTKTYRTEIYASGAALALTAFLVLLQGCTVGPRYVAPVTPAPPAFKETAAAQQSSDGTMWIPATPQDATLRGNWWELYQEPELNALEEKLNTSNQNIAQSFQNFMAARAQVKQARAAYYPTVTVGTAYTRARTPRRRDIATLRRQREQQRFQSAVRCLLGARRLGAHSKHCTGIRECRPGQCCRRRQRTAQPAGKPSRILFRAARTGCPDRPLRKDRIGLPGESKAHAGTEQNRRRYGAVGRRSRAQPQDCCCRKNQSPYRASAIRARNRAPHRAGCLLVFHTRPGADNKRSCYPNRCAIPDSATPA